MEYYSAIKRSTLESVLMKWMKLEPAIQNEVSLKEKNKYCILMHICGIQKDGTDEPVLSGDTDIENRLWTRVEEERERVRCMERVT